MRMPVLKKNALNEPEAQSQIGFPDNHDYENGILLIGVHNKMEADVNRPGVDQPSTKAKKVISKEETNKAVSFADSDCVIPCDVSFTDPKDTKEVKKVVKKSWVYSYNFGGNNPSKVARKTKSPEIEKSPDDDRCQSRKDKKCKYDFTKASKAHKDSPPRLAKYSTSTSPSSIQKSYNIGKNTKFNISVSHPMAGIMNRGAKNKKSIGDSCPKTPAKGKIIVKNNSKIPTGPKIGGRCPSFLNPAVGRQERQLLKDVMSPFPKKILSPRGGAGSDVTNRHLPLLPPETDPPTNGEEESDESFRTFVLETSVYDDIDMSSALASRLLNRRADVGNMVISKSPSGSQEVLPEQLKKRRKFLTNKIENKLLPFRSNVHSKLKTNFSESIDKCFSLVEDDDIQEKDKDYETVMVPPPDYDNRDPTESWNQNFSFIPRRVDSCTSPFPKEDLNSFGRLESLTILNSMDAISSPIPTCCTEFTTGNLGGEKEDNLKVVSKARKNYIDCISNIKKSWKKPSKSATKNGTKNLLKHEPLNFAIGSCSEISRFSDLQLPRAPESFSKDRKPSLIPVVPPRTTSKPDYHKFASFESPGDAATDPRGPGTGESAKLNSLNVSCSCSPKPSKGILKKPNPPVVIEKPPDPENEGSLPRSPRELDSPIGSPTESDSGLDCEFEFREEEARRGLEALTYDSNSSHGKRGGSPQEPIKKGGFVDQVLRGWKQKYDFLLGLVKEPGRLLPDNLTEEVRLLETKRQGFYIERSLVRANLDSWENMGGGAKGRRTNDRPEGIRALYEQVANLDCMLTSLETQIEVLSSVQDSLPKEFHVDTFHDSGTSGHEPDSLEAIENLVGGCGDEGGHMDVRHRGSPDSDGGRAEGPGNGPGPGGGSPAGEAAVLLHLERCAHRQTRRCLQETKLKLESLQQEVGEKKLGRNLIRSVGSNLENLHMEHEVDLNSLESFTSIASADRLVEELKLREMTISQLRMRVLQLEKARLDKVPMDAAKEISRLKASIIQLEKARDELTLQNFTLKSRLAEVTSKIHDPTATYQVNKELSLSGKENIKPDGDNNKDSEIHKILRKSTYKVSSESQKLLQLYSEFGATEEEYKRRIDDLELELRNQQNSATQKFDRHIRNLENQLQETQKKVEVTEQYLLGKEEECNMVKLDFDTINEENKRLKEQLNETLRKQQEISSLNARCHQLGHELSRLEDENRLLVEDFNRERVLRKKYYNQIEEMKGKIRVFCRLRPFSETERRSGSGGEEVTKVEDEFSLLLETNRGPKSFLFDRVFTPTDGQEQVFEDTYALIQSALDGYNVTIMAYGQTGSGKTHTMLGTEASPGIAPRAFNRIFQMAEEGKARFDVAVSAYMMELYNDRLIDLLKCNGYSEPPEKLDIKRDKKGAVYVSGAIVRNVSSATELMRVFEEGLSNRHTACTKMNLNSSRSHLIITVLLTVTSKQTGSVFKGKLTLVDLAGSERVQKSGVTANQLKEANSINKSLSALGDVVAALSSESSFVPYRNSKLTMLLQDSIGGNAKSLVFVNISPAAFNCDETLTSLMYASRIKQITNNACKNADNREISRLKMIISKLKKGEEIVDEEL